MKRFDRAYFDKWYRDPRHRVAREADVARKARLALGVAEYLLGRPVRSVLDVGAGEGSWAPVLRRLRPDARYVGVDPSEYAVRRFGRRRNLRQGSIDTLDRQGWRARFDLVVCCDILNYLDARTLERGLAQVRDLLGGVAYLEIFTSADEMTGDLDGWHSRSPAYYRRLMRKLGLVPCGMHCYVGDELEPVLGALEAAGGDAGRP